MNKVVFLKEKSEIEERHIKILKILKKETRK